LANGSSGVQYASCSGGGPSERQLLAALKPATTDDGHAGSQQQLGVHVPLFKSAHMQVDVKLVLLLSLLLALLLPSAAAASIAAQSIG
jgi:hypothetical protein